MRLLNPYSLITHNPDETIKLGRYTSEFIEPGDVVILEGELASGKTTFLKGVISGLGYDGPVTSPTFTLINEYAANTTVIHIDCYRETNINRWLALGVQEYFYTDNIVFIEWPEILKSILPENLIIFRFSHSYHQSRRLQCIL